MMKILLFLLSLSPQIQAVLSRMEGYGYAPEPEAGDTVRGWIVLQVGDLFAETLGVVRGEGFLQIRKGDSVLLEEKGDTVSLMGPMFRFSRQVGMDTSFWKGAEIRREGDLEVVEGEVGGVRMEMWVDGAGRVRRQRVVMGGEVVEGVWLYDDRTGYVREIRWMRGQGPGLKIVYDWGAGR